MKTFVLTLLALLSAVSAQSQQQYYRQQQQQIQQPLYSQKPQQPLPVILSHKQALGQDGSFRYQFAADNGLQQGESIAPDGTRTGQYSYVDPNGQKVMIKYVAGKDGFRVLEGNHLPKAPQAPQAAPQQVQPQQQYYQPPQPQYQPPQPQYQQAQPQYQPAQQQYQPQQQYQSQPRYYQGNQKEDDGSYRSEDHDEGQYDPRVYEVQENQQQQQQQSQQYRGPHTFGSGYAFEFAG